MTDDELSDVEQQSSPIDGFSNSERLFAAFQRCHIRLRLHGCRVPPNYTVSLRLPSGNDRKGQPQKPKRRRWLADPVQTAWQSKVISSDDSDSNQGTRRHPNMDADIVENVDNAAGAASDDEEDKIIRKNNAYTGSTNTIGSVHQRHWFLTLDRRRSGFHKARSGKWEGGSKQFVVRGRDRERSVVTGRSADEVMKDEGVETFVGRKLWRPILE